MEVKPQYSEIAVRPVRVEYQKQYFNPADAFMKRPQDELTIKVSHGEIAAITLNCREETGCDFDPEQAPEMPAETESEKKPPYQTMPDVEHCKKIIGENYRNWKMS